MVGEVTEEEAVVWRPRDAVHRATPDDAAAPPPPPAAAPAAATARPRAALNRQGVQKVGPRVALREDMRRLLTT